MNWPEMYSKKIQKAGGLNEYLQKKESRSAGALIKRLRKTLPQGSRILEIGTGTGAIGTLLIKYGFKVTAIDNNQGMADIAKRFFGIFGKADNVLIADANNIVNLFGKDSFDCVISHGMLGHYSDAEILHFLDLQLSVAPIVIFVISTQPTSAEYRAKGFGDERYLPTRYWKSLIKKRFYIKNVFGFGFKETNIPRWFEWVLRIDILAKLFAPLCGINEFWIIRKN